MSPTSATAQVVPGLRCLLCLRGTFLSTITFITGGTVENTRFPPYYAVAISERPVLFLLSLVSLIVAPRVYSEPRIDPSPTERKTAREFEAQPEPNANNDTNGERRSRARRQSAREHIMSSVTTARARMRPPASCR